MQPTLLTTREAASLLRISQQGLRRLADRGLIRRVELNQRVHRYTLASIDALISRKSEPRCDEDLVKLGDGAADHITGNGSTHSLG